MLRTVCVLLKAGIMSAVMPFVCGCGADCLAMGITTSAFSVCHVCVLWPFYYRMMA
jgi:preprotein translocase subunit SecD